MNVFSPMKALGVVLTLAGLLFPLAAHAQTAKLRVGMARAYAKGTIFTLNNPEAAVRGVLKQKVETSDLISNELIEEINRLDAGKVAADAKAYTYAR